MLMENTHEATEPKKVSTNVYINILIHQDKYDSQSALKVLQLYKT